MDWYIDVDERGENNGIEVEYRVVVFPDYQERIRVASGKQAYVGAIVIESHDYAHIIPLKQWACKIQILIFDIVYLRL